MKMLRFGGPGLPPGTKTWFDMPAPETPSGFRQFFVAPGEMIAAELVCRDTGEVDENGKAILTPNADYYVQTGRAEAMPDDADDPFMKPVTPAGG